MSKRAIFSLGGGAANCGLLFGGPRDEVRAQVNTIARGRTAISRITSPVGVSVGTKSKRTVIEMKTICESALNIAQDVFNSYKMTHSGRMHVLASLVDSKRKLKSSNGKVLKGTGNTAI